MTTEYPMIDTAEWPAKIEAEIRSDKDSVLNQVKWGWFPDGMGTHPVETVNEIFFGENGEMSGVTKKMTTYSLQRAHIKVAISDDALNDAISKLKALLEGQFWKSCVQLLPTLPALNDRVGVDGASLLLQEINGISYSIWWHPECFEFLVPKPLLSDEFANPLRCTPEHWRYAALNGEEAIYGTSYLAVRPLNPVAGFKSLRNS